MPAHSPASRNTSTPFAFIESIKKKPAWLIPIVGGIIILFLLTALITVPSPKKQTLNKEQVIGQLPQPSALPATHDTDAVRYENLRYGFALYFPKNWSEKYSVTESPEGMSVKYTASGNSIELFTVQAMTEESWRDSTDKPFLLSSKKGIVFAYTTPALAENPFNGGDPTGALLKEYKSLLSEVPKLMQSFEFVR